ncbi:hypothetical protein DSC45_05295 [Streptomyces sp. YIM 130001]|nr:hypothetical protein DSC45_05295 [Streptomyces sp. YIM 130001]
MKRAAGPCHGGGRPFVMRRRARCPLPCLTYGPGARRPPRRIDGGCAGEGAARAWAGYVAMPVREASLSAGDALDDPVAYGPGNVRTPEAAWERQGRRAHAELADFQNTYRTRIMQLDATCGPGRHRFDQRRTRFGRGRDGGRQAVPDTFHGTVRRRPCGRRDRRRPDHRRLRETPVRTVHRGQGAFRLTAHGASDSPRTPPSPSAACRTSSPMPPHPATHLGGRRRTDVGDAAGREPEHDPGLFGTVMGGVDETVDVTGRGPDRGRDRVSPRPPRPRAGLGSGSSPRRTRGGTSSPSNRARRADRHR